MVSTASLLGAWHLRNVVENKPASSLVVFFGKALNGMSPSLCGRQIAQTPRKWQLPSECRHPAPKTAIHFAFSRIEDKHGQKNLFLILEINKLEFFTSTTIIAGTYWRKAFKWHYYCKTLLGLNCNFILLTLNIGLQIV